MEALPDPGATVEQVLDLLTTLPILVAVTLYRQHASGTASITVRKITHQHGHQRDPHPQHHYRWAIRVTNGAQAWDDTGVHAYPTAGTAYRVAVRATQAVPLAPGSP